MKMLFPLGLHISDFAFLGFILLLLVPVMLLTSLILKILKKSEESKRVLIGAGILLLIGVGLCGLGNI